MSSYKGELFSCSLPLSCLLQTHFALTFVPNKNNNNNMPRMLSFSLPSLPRASISAAVTTWTLLVSFLQSMTKNVAVTVAFTVVIFLCRSAPPLYASAFTWPMWFALYPAPKEPFSYLVLWHGDESISRPGLIAMPNFVWAIIVFIVPLSVVGVVQIFVRNIQDFWIGWSAAVMAGDLV